MLKVLRAMRKLSITSVRIVKVIRSKFSVRKSVKIKRKWENLRFFIILRRIARKRLLFAIYVTFETFGASIWSMTR